MARSLRGADTRQRPAHRGPCYTRARTAGHLYIPPVRTVAGSSPWDADRIAPNSQGSRGVCGSG